MNRSSEREGAYLEDKTVLLLSAYVSSVKVKALFPSYRHFLWLD